MHMYGQSGPWHAHARAAACAAHAAPSATLATALAATAGRALAARSVGMGNAHHLFGDEGGNLLALLVVERIVHRQPQLAQLLVLGTVRAIFVVFM
jgi:hypothetical protein